MGRQRVSARYEIVGPQLFFFSSKPSSMIWRHLQSLRSRAPYNQASGVLEYSNKRIQLFLTTLFSSVRPIVLLRETFFFVVSLFCLGGIS